MVFRHGFFFIEQKSWLWAVLIGEFLYKLQQADLLNSWGHPVWVYVTMTSNFYKWCKIGVQLHSFTYEYPVFPIFIEEAVLSPITIFGSLVKY